jgi:hypothetical protein
VFSVSNQLYFKPPNEAVILSEALCRSIANRGLYGAEPKDLGDASWQMLLGAFRPQTTPEDKKVTNSERSERICGAPFVCPAPAGPQPPPIITSWEHQPPPCHPGPHFLPRCAGHGGVCAFLIRKGA